MRRDADGLLGAVRSLPGTELPDDPPNFVYVRDRVTGEWMNRHCELRVPIARKLPDPLRTEDHGDALSVQLHAPVSVRSAGLRSIDYVPPDA